MIRTAAFATVGTLLLAFGVNAQTLEFPQDGFVSRATGTPYADFIPQLEAAIEENELFLVAKASASAAANNRGVEIPGNAVLMVYDNQFAVRMLEASVPAGFEAPLRLYVTEAEDGNAVLSWRTATAVFAPYDSEELDQMAQELDALLEEIAAAALEQ